MPQKLSERLTTPDGSNVSVQQRLIRVADNLSIAHLKDYERQQIEVNLLALEYITDKAEGLQ